MLLLLKTSLTLAFRSSICSKFPPAAFGVESCRAVSAFTLLAWIFSASSGGISFPSFKSFTYRKHTKI